MDKETKVTFRLTPSTAKKFKVKLATKSDTAQGILEKAVLAYLTGKNTPLEGK